MLRDKLYQLGLKVETTEGTKIALVAGDFLPVANAKFTPGIKMSEIDKVSGSMSPSENRPGLRFAKISFDYYLRGAAAAGTAPESGVALKACGVNQAIVASTSVTYSPAAQTVTIPSVTIELQRDGKISRIWGARGTATLDIKSGGPAVWHFEFSGADWEEVDGGFTAGVSYAALAEPIFLGGTLTLDGSGANIAIEALKLDFGNTVALRPSMAASSGYISARITGRKPTVSIDPENVLVSEYDFLGKWKAGATVALVVAQTSGAAGNKVTISVPKLQFQGISEADREGVSTLNIDGLCCRTSMDDEYSIAFT